MLDTYLNYVDNYNALNSEEKKAHKEMLTNIINEMKDTSGSYPVVLGLLLADNTEFSVLLSGDLSPLGDAEFKKKLAFAYREAVYAYQKRLVIICDLCLDEHSVQYRFCGKFTSFDNVAAIAELISIPFGTLRRLQKAAADRRQISKIRSCAVKLRIPLDNMLEMVEDAKAK